MGKRGPQKGDPRCAEAGRKGGMRTASSQDMRAIGKKGGEAVREKYGNWYFKGLSELARSKKESE